MQRYHIPAHPRYALLLGVLLTAILILAACESASTPVANTTQSKAVEVSTSVIPGTATPAATFVPTYIVYGRMVQATARAIAPMIPTPSPKPRLTQYLQEAEQRDYVVNSALNTAVAMNPTPFGHNPSEEFERLHPTTPQPPEPLPPHEATENGRLYYGPPQNVSRGSTIQTVNFWVGRLNGQWTTVYAGQAREPERAGQGMILVDILLPPAPSATPEAYQHTEEINYYATPLHLGPVRITAVSSTQFTLITVDPRFPTTTFAFDLATRQWVPPPTPGPSPVPTVLPVPSITP